MNSEMPESSSSPDRSPSFDTYSSGKSAEIAARVVQEFDNGTVSDSNFYDSNTERCKQSEQGNCYEENDQDESCGEFQFSIVRRDQEETISISADEIFCNGQIRPVYPLFNTDLISNALCTINEERNTIKTKATSNRLPLRQLFSEEERELTSTSCSSSEGTDELDGAERGTYCVWTPKRAGKSGSTGFPKRGKFRDLLYRIRNEGKETFEFRAPNNNNQKNRGSEADNNSIKYKGGGRRS